jgi:hypothetical protein
LTDAEFTLIIWIGHMEPKKITIKDLGAVYRELQKGTESAIGNYLYKGLRIQVSKYKSSGTERYMRLYNKRRDDGLCIRCGVKVTKKNPHTGKLYRLCEFHRDVTDRRK